MIQFNAGKSWAAHELLSVTANQHKGNLVLMSEPNERVHKGTHYNNRGDAAIIITDTQKRRERRARAMSSSGLK